MNKRTITYVLLVTVVFFGLNIFFSYQRDQKNRELLQQKEAQQAKNQERLQAELKTRKENVTNLPIVTIDDHQGLQLGDSLVTLAWKRSMPETLSIGSQTYHLRTDDSVVDGPVLYASPSFKQLEIASLPSVGSSDLQLVTFQDGQAAVFLGEYKEGQLSIYEGPLKSNALALYRSGSSWLLAGLYEWRGNLFIPMQDLPLFGPLVKQPNFQATTDKSHQYYVLENDYVQLVFSNVGGALSEINLPLHTDKESYSVVNEIGFDREIIKDSPANAHFPEHPYHKAGSSEVQPPGPIGGFYPLIRRDLFGTKKEFAIAPQYYAMNIVSDYPEMAELPYEVQKFTEDEIIFVATQPHRKITKTFKLHPGHEGAPYCFDLTVKVDGDARGLWLTSGVPEVEIMSNSSSPQLQYRVIRKGKGEVEKLGLPKPKEALSSTTIQPDWMVDSNGYLGVIIDPLTDIGTGYKAAAIPGQNVPTRLSVIDPKYQPYKPSKYPGYEIYLPLPSKGGTSSFRVYAGPFEEKTLKAVDRMFADKMTGYNPDYAAARNFYGWFSFISKPFSKLLFIVMSFFHTITGSWGFSIILLTVFLRVLLYPLNAWSFKSMRRMQKLSPQVQAIQKKYKKDPKRSQMEIMTLYREKKVNPFMGCVPILIQLPFLIAMFDLLKSSFQLRGASFIPGWIENLTAPDVLFSWQTPIFFLEPSSTYYPSCLEA